jgi:hypothetical protein
MSPYVTSRKTAGSVPQEVIEFFAVDLIFLAALGPGAFQPLTETSTRNLPVGLSTVST